MWPPKQINIFLAWKRKIGWVLKTTGFKWLTKVLTSVCMTSFGTLEVGLKVKTWRYVKHNLGFNMILVHLLGKFHTSRGRNWLCLLARWSFGFFNLVDEKCWFWVKKDKLLSAAKQNINTRKFVASGTWLANNRDVWKVSFVCGFTEFPLQQKQEEWDTRLRHRNVPITLTSCAYFGKHVTGRPDGNSLQMKSNFLLNLPGFSWEIALI